MGDVETVVGAFDHQLEDRRFKSMLDGKMFQLNLTTILIKIAATE